LISQSAVESCRKAQYFHGTLALVELRVRTLALRWNFCPSSPSTVKKHQGQRSATLYFLDFTHYCTRNRKGSFKVGRKTEKSRLRHSLARLEELMREIRHEPVKDQVTNLNHVLRGHYATCGG
jgi:hypothetical protein